MQVRLGLWGVSEHISAETAVGHWFPRGRIYLISLVIALGPTPSACTAEVVRKRGSRLMAVGISVYIFGLMLLLTG